MIVLRNFYLPFCETCLFIFYAVFNFLFCNSCTIFVLDFLRLDILHKFAAFSLTATPFTPFFAPNFPYYYHLCHFLPFIFRCVFFCNCKRRKPPTPLFSLPSCTFADVMIY